MAVMLGGLAGCNSELKGPAGIEIEPPRPMWEVIQRVNANSAAMGFLLKAGAVSATGKYVDDRGVRRSIDMSGTLLYRKPRDLYVRLSPILGSIEAGSNDAEFWIWQKIDEYEYVWGSYENLESLPETDVPIRPDLLVEVLGLDDLPTQTTGPKGPTMWVGTRRYELLFLEDDETGQYRLAKAVDIDRSPPYLVRSIVYFRRNGVPAVRAELSNHSRVENTGVLVPKKIRIEWLGKDSWVELTFGTLSVFEESEAVIRRFQSPRQRGVEESDLGRMIRVGETSRPESPGVPAPGNGPDTITE